MKYITLDQRVESINKKIEKTIKLAGKYDSTSDFVNLHETLLTIKQEFSDLEDFLPMD